MQKKRLEELRANARWDRLHMCSMGTKLTLDKACLFADICEERGITVYEALRRFCVATIYRPETLDNLKWRRAPKRKRG